MTPTQVYKKFDRQSKKIGKQKFQSMLDRICKNHNVMRVEAGEMTDENEKEFAAYVLFEYDSSVEKCGAAYRNFEEARLDVICFLQVFGLTLAYECNGDGDGILMSYRIVEDYNS